MNTQHTPGPWIANDKDEIRSSENTLLATVWDTYEKQENDARLMAAAPELLDALQELSEAGLVMESIPFYKALKKARTLIDKLTDQ